MAIKKGGVPREKTLLKVVGQSFLLKRNELGLQLLDVSNRSGVTALTISKLEKGKLANTSIETLQKIAGALELTLQIKAE